MLAIAQPALGAVEEVVMTLINGHIVRSRNRPRTNAPASSRVNYRCGISQDGDAVTSAPSDIFLREESNEILQELSHFLRSTKVNHQDLTITQPKKVSFKFLKGNLLINYSKSPLVTVQRRGFRTRSYQSKMEDKQSREEPSLLNYLGVSSKIKTAWHKSVKEDTLKNILETPDLRGPEKIKIAFAEGYFAAQHKKKKVSWASYFWVALCIGGLAYVYLGNMGVQFRLGSSTVSQVTPEEVSVTFDDVKGIEEAKEEVMKIVDYLKDPAKYTKLGAHLPKGVLLVGLPGSGKTLLAKAIAGEAQVPFFRTSGSEFEEMLVGLGAKRVRELFATARNRAPCVIFIDEIDSIGSKRSYSAFHPYANQTINQLLNEMDGFLSTTGVIVLAATNRSQDLDPALLRPGRFDVEVSVPWPDLQGRIDIFNLYLSKVKKDADVEVEKLAKSTVGFSGADIENMVNQAALKAAADNQTSVNMNYLDMAHDLVKMGPARKNLPSDKEVNVKTAYHEAGHALVAYFTKDAIPLHKVTIVPRGQTLGHTAYRPDKEVYGQTKAQLLADLDVCMGGRAAEELVFGADKVSTGIMSDMQRASKTAEYMVKKYGMSDKTGFRFFESSNLQSMKTISNATAELVDSEIKRLLQESYDRAKTILKTNATAHKKLADALVEYETLTAEEIKLVVDGQPLNKSLKLKT